MCCGACGANDERTATEEALSCEAKTEVPVQSPLRTDPLVLLDARATALPGFAAQARSLMAALESLPIDFNIAVAGAPAGCLADGLTVITRRLQPSGAVVTNVAGSLGDAFACLAAGTTGTDPLARLADAPIPGFQRKNARLAAIVVATEDASAAATASAEARLQTLGASRFPPPKIVIAPVTASTLIAFSAGSHDKFIALPGGDWEDALGPLYANFTDPVGPPCLLGDIPDPAQCVVSEVDTDTGAEHLLSFCPDGVGPRPCWWFDAPPDACWFTPQHVALHVEIDAYAEGASTRVFRCPTTCQ